MGKIDQPKFHEHWTTVSLISSLRKRGFFPDTLIHDISIIDFLERDETTWVQIECEHSVCGMHMD
jgi:hypothetical protein